MKRMWSKNELKQQNIANAIELLGSGQVPSIKGGEIIENMSGYAFEIISVEHLTQEGVYAGVVKNGNKLTLCYAVNLQQDGSLPANTAKIAKFTLPTSIMAKLYPTQVGTYNVLAYNLLSGIKEDNTNKTIEVLIEKETNSVTFGIRWSSISDIPTGSNIYLRFENTFLLSDNLVPSE